MNIEEFVTYAKSVIASRASRLMLNFDVNDIVHVNDNGYDLVWLRQIYELSDEDGETYVGKPILWWEYQDGTYRMMCRLPYLVFVRMPSKVIIDGNWEKGTNCTLEYALSRALHNKTHHAIDRSQFVGLDTLVSDNEPIDAY